ncbi:hypothetical protein WMY93_006261 [Mugilogobius chulae]|uniref:Uncharacterized protein n=1 Tax=Mugilogobius chulae TaxID=88201 RepID=A0AAW0PNB6_9GOBI
MDAQMVLLVLLFCTGALFAAATAPTEPEVLTASEGGNVTVWTGLNNQNLAVILTSGNKTLFHFDDNSIQHQDNNTIVKNDSIVMINLRKSDAIYKLQIFINDVLTTELHFRLNVTERQHLASEYSSTQTTPSPNTTKTKGHLAWIAVGSLALIGIVALSIVCGEKGKAIF